MTSALSDGLSAPLLQFLVNHTGIGVAWASEDGTIASANDALARMSERTPESLAGLSILDILSPSSRDLFTGAIKGSETLGTIEMSLNLLTPTGIRRPCSGRLWRASGCIVAVFVDASAPEQMADVATGAETPDSFLEHLSLRLYDAGRYGIPASVLVCDICNYETLRRGYGEAVASRVAAMAGWTLRNLTRRSDYVARVSQGEFAVLLPDTTLAGALAAAEKLTAPLARIGIETDDAVVAPAVRFGAVAVTDGTDCGPKAVLEAAMEAARAASPGTAEAVPLAGLRGLRAVG